MDKPRTRRSGAGPGRGTPRTRTGARSTADPRQVREPVGGQPTDEALDLPVSNRRELVTWRGIAFCVVVLMVLLSSVSSLRIYLDTDRQNAENRQSIERSQAHIDELNAQLARWDDPDYVRAQARERLGWVLVGETGYRVIGPDGKPVGVQIETQSRDTRTPPPAPWWSRMWTSMNEADKPKPVPTVAPSTPPPITDGGRTGQPTSAPTKKGR